MVRRAGLAVVAGLMLHSRALKVRERGGGLFGILVKSNWVVTGQSPHAGTRVRRGSLLCDGAVLGCFLL